MVDKDVYFAQKYLKKNWTSRSRI